MLHADKILSGLVLSQDTTIGRLIDQTSPMDFWDSEAKAELFEFSEFGINPANVRGFLQLVGINHEGIGYNAMIRASQDPGKEGLFTQLDFWWEEGTRNTSQNCPLWKAIIAFLKSESNKFLRSSLQGDMEKRLYGRALIDTGVTIGFAFRRFTLLDCSLQSCQRVVYTLWSYPKILSD